MYYGVSARVDRPVGDGYTSTMQLPTFLLDSNIQGIVSADHAERIARRMLEDAAGPDGAVYLSVMPFDS